MSQLNLSARGYHPVLKLAWSIDDLAGSDEIQSVHLAEALHTIPVPFGSKTDIDDWLYQPFINVDIKS
jgi:hypothetical protein